MTVLPQHPAYDLPDNAARLTREWVEPGSPLHVILADPEKAAREIYKISGNNDVGLRVALGHDSLAVAKEKVKELEEYIHKSEEFCMDLKFEA